MLQEHIDHEYGEEGSSLTLQSVADNSDWVYANCSLCGKRLQSESEMEFHIQRFHEYREECALYRCMTVIFASSHTAWRWTDPDPTKQFCVQK